MKKLILIFTLCFIPKLFAQADKQIVPATSAVETLEQTCFSSLKDFGGPFDEKALKAVCQKVSLLENCHSHEGAPIYHYDKDAIDNSKAKRILVFSLIHGDETSAGSVGRFWIERLDSIEPRNVWRVVPVLNPDGVKRKTRTNANKVDLNRNFPTKDWDDEAVKYWKHQGANPRRFPGEKPASEPETLCALKHIEQFKPDFIISVHTPLNVLDFDGPKVRTPPYDYLPWKSLGHFPGSLGRYMWFERKTPVLTMELKESLPSNFRTFENLQDIIGTLVKLEIRSD